MTTNIRKQTLTQQAHIPDMLKSAHAHFILQLIIQQNSTPLTTATADVHEE
jgi:hypothetical protein